MLELIDVHTYYGESYILQGVSLRLEESYVVAMLGRNGMGKTTTIRCILGLTPPRRGIVQFKGKDITNLPPYKIARMGIGLVPQGRQIFPSLTVTENLTMTARASGRDGAWSLDRVYSLFPILKVRAKNRGTLLSGGEQQMLAIGRALMTNPDLILMDEPSEGLAPIIVQEVVDTINELKASNFSILLVEQNFSMAMKVADYVYIVSKGRIPYESAKEEFLNNEEIRNQYLGVRDEYRPSRSFPPNCNISEG